MASIYLGLIALAAFVFQNGQTIPVDEGVMTKTSNGSTDGGFCEVSIPATEMEDILSKMQKYSTDQIDIISLIFMNASRMIPSTYKSYVGEYLFFRYAIVNQKGKAILKFPNDADFLSSSILSAYKLSLNVNLLLSSKCNLTEREFRTQVSQLAFDILNNSSYTTICRYQVDTMSNYSSWLTRFVPKYTWDPFPTECVGKDQNIFILGTSPIVYIIYAIVVLICAYIPLTVVALPNDLSDETYTSYVPGDQPFSLRRLAIHILHMKPAFVLDIYDAASDQSLQREDYCEFVSYILRSSVARLFFTPAGRVGLIFMCVMNIITAAKKGLHLMFDSSEAKLNYEITYPDNEDVLSDKVALQEFALYMFLSVIFLFLFFVQCGFYSNVPLDPSTILLFDKHKGVVRINLPNSLSPTSNINRDLCPWANVPTIMLKAIACYVTPKFWKVVVSVSCRKIFKTKVHGMKSLLQRVYFTVFGIFCLLCNFVYLTLATFIPILRISIFGAMGIFYSFRKRGRRCFKIIVATVLVIYQIFILILYFGLAAEIIFQPFLLVIEFVSYTLFVGVPFYPEYAVPRVALILAIIGYLFKFWNNFQSGYAHILQVALKEKKEQNEKEKNDEKESVTVVQFNEICRRVYPFYKSFGLFLGKVLLTVLFLSLVLISLYESGSFKKYPRFGELLSTTLFVFAPGFIDSFFQKDNALWEHKMDVEVRSIIKSENIFKSNIPKEDLGCKLECCLTFVSCECFVFCCPCSIEFPLIQQYRHTYKNMTEKRCCDKMCMRCIRYEYDEEEETSDRELQEQIQEIGRDRAEITVNDETIPLLQ